MAQYRANWRLDGFRGEVHEPGAVIEADLDEVKQFVSKEHGGEVAGKGTAVLTPVAAAPASDGAAETDESVATGVKGADVDLTSLKKDELLAHALEHHDLELPTAATKADIIAKIEDARTVAAAPASDGPAETETEATA